LKQITIGKKVEGVGIGLHKGEPIKITLEPMEENSGIVFYRSDENVTIEAKAKNVVDTKLATAIGKDNVSISTIEHLLSAIYAYGIDNIRITLDGAEVPIMDGSAASFCMMLDEAGRVEQLENKKVMLLKKKVEIKIDDRYVKLTPAKTASYDFKIFFDHPVILEQNFSFNFSRSGFLKEISRARTFGFLKDVQSLRANGLALGGSLENVVVLDEKKILNHEGLRYKDEFVRHKILDAIGDLCLLGAPLIATYESYAGSHQLNHLLTKELLNDKENYEIISPLQVREMEFKKVFA
jgi:UDP-3-O-[3-hydroxymyristoyl] N-acetylglucosamine deacetylase